MHAVEGMAPLLFPHEKVSGTRPAKYNQREGVCQKSDVPGEEMGWFNAGDGDKCRNRKAGLVLRSDFLISNIIQDVNHGATASFLCAESKNTPTSAMCMCHCHSWRVKQVMHWAAQRLPLLGI